jgi:hypothetical protein
MYGNEAGDSVIAIQELKTDPNGALIYETTFRKQNYFDVELAFEDAQGKQTVGFLIQPREASSFMQKGVLFASGMLVGLLIFLGAPKASGAFYVQKRRH